MDFRQAMLQAQKLDDLADKVNGVSSRELSHAMSTLQSAWRGQSASMFIEKTQTVDRQVQDSARELHEIAESIRRIARTIYNAEMEAWRIAHERN